MINIAFRQNCHPPSNNHIISNNHNQFSDEFSRRIEIQKAYVIQREIEGLSRYSYPRVGEIDLLFKKSMIKQYKLGEGISDGMDKTSR